MKLKKIPMMLFCVGGVFCTINTANASIEFLDAYDNDISSENIVQKPIPINKPQKQVAEISAVPIQKIEETPQQIAKVDKKSDKKNKKKVVKQEPSLTTQNNQEATKLSNVHFVGFKNVDHNIIVPYLKQVSPMYSFENAEVINGQNKHIEEEILKSGYFQNVSVNTDSNRAMTISVKENPLINEININGASAIKDKNILDIYEKNKIAKGTVFNGKIIGNLNNTLLENYHSLGREQAKVTSEVKQNAENGNLDLTLNIVEGPINKVNNISFVGNTIYSDKELKRIMTTSESTSVNKLIRKNKLLPDTFKTDLEKIVFKYQNSGYYEASVLDANITKDTTNEKDEFKDIQIKIHEGDIYHIGNVRLGVSEELRQIINNEDEEFKKLFKIKKNELFKFSNVIETRDNLNKYFSDRGYAFNTVDIQDTPDKENKLVNFNFIVNPNNKVQINNITVVGNKKTKDNVVLREMRQKSGDTYDLSKLQRSKERVEMTGFFNNVDIKTKQVAADKADIEVEVSERRTGTFEASVGYMQDYGPTFGVAASDLNFRGSGNSLGVQLNRNKVNSNASVTYGIPYINDKGIGLTTTLYGNAYDPRKYSDSTQSYKNERFGGNLTWKIPINEYDNFYVGTGIERVQIQTFDNSSKRYKNFIKENDGDNKTGVGKYDANVGKLTLGWGRNKLNHPYWPTKGYMTKFNSDFTIPGSDLEYYKFNFNNKFFIPVAEKSTIMLSGNIGYADSYGKTKDLPFFESYGGGGLSSVRGYESNTLGPKVYDVDGSVVHYGGNYMASGSVEFQTPVPFIKDSSNVRLSAFVDAASVWDNKTYSAADSDINQNVYDGLHKSSFKNELRTSAGLAYTWLSPIGPVKFSYAVPLNKKDNDSVQKFQFQLGTVF